MSQTQLSTTDTSSTKMEAGQRNEFFEEINPTDTIANETNDTNDTATTIKSNENINKIENIGPDIDSNKLILERIEKLNVDNHCLKQETIELNNRINELNKSCSNFKTKAELSTKQADSMRTELQSMVIKYATSERDVIELKKRFNDVDKKYKELIKERDHLQAKTKDLMQDKKQLMTNLEKHVLDAAYLTNKNDILKNKLEQQELSIQRLQLSFDDISKQYEKSKSTLQSIELAMKKINLDNEEIVNDKMDEMVNENENLEEKSNLVESSINGSSSESNKWINIYLNCVKSNNNLSAEVDQFKNEIEKYKMEISDLNVQLSKSNEQIKNSLKKLELIETLKNELINRQNVINDLKEKFDKINEINRDLLNDASSSKHKESELLEYTERLTAKLVSLQSEHNIINEKLKNLEEDCRKYSEEKNFVTIERDNLQNELNALKTNKENEIKDLTEQISNQNNELEYLKRKIEELENDINIMRRKHILNLKELNKEIQVLKKQTPKQKTKSINNPQSPAQQTSENSSTLSSHNSLSSLNEINDQMFNNGEKVLQNMPNDSIIDFNSYVNEESSVSEFSNYASNHQNALETVSPQLISSNELTSLNDIDKNRLIERILRLQRQAIKRNEKIDFLEEHNAQLVEEMQKKSKLLQYYILKEETGALATETMDKNKVRKI